MRMDSCSRVMSLLRVRNDGKRSDQRPTDRGASPKHNLNQSLFWNNRSAIFVTHYRATRAALCDTRPQGA